MRAGAPPAGNAHWVDAVSEHQRTTTTRAADRTIRITHPPVRNAQSISSVCCDRGRLERDVDGEMSYSLGPTCTRNEPRLLWDLPLLPSDS